MQHYLNTILDITAAAEDIPKRYFRQKLDIIHKGDDSPVTVADQTCERMIRDALAQHFPDHSILGEEFGHEDKGGDLLWIIDPIDGTRSFISGMPLYSMLIALLQNGVPKLGVLRMPELGEVFTGSAGGAAVNGTTISTSDVKALKDAFVYINEGNKIALDAPDLFRRLCQSGREQRLSYDGYPHMLVAMGHADACIDYDLQPYDFLPLVPVIEGAGGVITDWDGAPLTLQSDGRVVTAATKELHREMLDLLGSGQ
ncbi:inositol monophosphatase family protein [Profundibacter sp.]